MKFGVVMIRDRENGDLSKAPSHVGVRGLGQDADQTEVTMTTVCDVAMVTCNRHYTVADSNTRDLI